MLPDGILIVTVACCVAFSLGVDTTVELTLSSSVARPGDTLSAVCNATNMDSIGYILVWTRRLPEDGQEVEIATNAYPNKPYVTSGRYQGEVDGSLYKTHNIILYKLNITNLQAADSGNISCKVPGDNGQARSQSTKSFIVQVPVQRVQWSSRNWNTSRVDEYEDGQNVTYKETDQRELTCLINGSYPNPQVQVYLGAKDVTNNFTKTETMEFGSGGKIFRDVYYTIRVTQNVTVGFEFDVKQLKCLAKLGTIGNGVGVESQPENSSTINIELSEYKPKFLCSTVQVVELNHPYYPITCTVRAKPSVHDINFWPGVEYNETLEDGERRGEFKAEIKHGNDSLDTIMILTIDRVLNRHFRKYTFEATNSIGLSKLDIELRQDYSNLVNSGAKHTGHSNINRSPPAIQLLGLVLLLMLLLLTPTQLYV